MREWKEYLVRCECHDLRHLAVFQYLDTEQLYISVHLAWYRNIFQRIWVALKYVLGRKSDFGEYDEVILTPYAVRNLVAFLNTFVNAEV